MPWKTMDVREQRVSFVVSASRGERSLTALCARSSASRVRRAIYGCRAIGRAGWSGIAERSRRPAMSPDRTAPRTGSGGGRAARSAIRLGCAQAGGAGCGGAASSWRRARFIAFCCGMVWCTTRIGTARRPQRFERERAERALADGLQGAAAAGRSGRSAVGDRRPQPLPGGARSSWPAPTASWCGSIWKGPSASAGSGGHADGSRDSVVGGTGAVGTDQAVVVADEAGDRAALGPDPPSADPRQGGALPRRVAAGAWSGAAHRASDGRTGWTSIAGSTITCARTRRSAWQTPACRWRPSERRYDPQPLRLGVPRGRAGAQGGLRRKDRRCAESTG